MDHVTAVWPAITSLDIRWANADCGICGERGPLFSLAFSCVHAFCQECIARFITTTLQTGPFPMRCPGCQADAGSPQSLITRTTLKSLSVAQVLIEEQAQGEDGKFYFNTKNKKGESTVCECRRCDCDQWVSVNTINTPHHKAKPFHTAWATANGQPITKAYNIGAGKPKGQGKKTVTDKKPKREDLVKSINKVGEQMVALKAEMKRMVVEFNRLSEVIDKMDNTEQVEEEVEEAIEETEEVAGQLLLLLLMMMSH